MLTDELLELEKKVANALFMQLVESGWSQDAAYAHVRSKLEKEVSPLSADEYCRKNSITLSELQDEMEITEEYRRRNDPIVIKTHEEILKRADAIPESDRATDKQLGMFKHLQNKLYPDDPLLYVDRLSMPRGFMSNIIRVMLGEGAPLDRRQLRDYLADRGWLIVPRLEDLDGE